MIVHHLHIGRNRNHMPNLGLIILTAAVATVVVRLDTAHHQHVIMNVEQ